jgi:AraC-like DNA-binding protein
VEGLRPVHSIGADTREWLVSAKDAPALAEAGILLCGVSQARPGFRFVRHGWDRGQLLMALTPGGECLVDGAWRALAPGEGYLTPPGASHAYHCRPGGEWLAAWAMLDPAAFVLATDFPRSAGAATASQGPVAPSQVLVCTGAAPPLRCASGSAPRSSLRLLAPAGPAVVAGDARALHDAILNLHREGVGAAEPALLRQWGDLVAALVRRLLAPARTDARLGRLWEEVDADLSRPWTLADLARLAGLGGEQLRRLSLRQLGASPMHHLARLRMRRAASLLAAGGRTVAEVAAAVGYDNAFAFSTAFRRHHRVPPSQLLPG